MLSLSERLDRVNKLRQQAMVDPEFVESAKSHEIAIQAESESSTSKSKSKSKTKKKRFSDVYKDITFGEERSSNTH